MLKESQDDRGDHRAGRGAGYRQGRVGVLRAGARPGRVGAAGCRRSRTYSTMTRSLQGLAERLLDVGGDPGGDGGHQRLLEAAVLPAGGAGLEPWLVNAKDVKHLPGRPKTDRLDAVWLCKVAERQMIRPELRAPARRSAGCGI